MKAALATTCIVTSIISTAYCADKSSNIYVELSYKSERNEMLLECRINPVLDLCDTFNISFYESGRRISPNSNYQLYLSDDGCQSSLYIALGKNLEMTSSRGPFICKADNNLSSLISKPSNIPKSSREMHTRQNVAKGSSPCLSCPGTQYDEAKKLRISWEVSPLVGKVHQNSSLCLSNVTSTGIYNCTIRDIPGPTVMSSVSIIITIDENETPTTNISSTAAATPELPENQSSEEGRGPTTTADSTTTAAISQTASPENDVVGVVVGAVFGGLLLLVGTAVLVVMAFFLWKRHRRSTSVQKKAESTGTISKEEFERKQKDGQHLEAVETWNEQSK